jgi:hypothetical protein
MPNYLSQYTRFSQGISQQLDASRRSALNSVSQSLNARAKLQAQRNQAEIERKAEIRSQIADDGRDFDADGMWDWQSEMLDQQRVAIGNSWMAGDIGELEYTNMLVGLGRNAEGYKATYEASVGNPTSSKDTDPTFWGVTKAMNSTIAGDNPYDDADLIIKGMDGGIEDIETAQKNLIYRFNTKNKGKSPDQQVLGGRYNEKFEWILTVGDPSNPSSHVEIPVNDYLASDEGRNSFLPEFSDINFNTIQDYSASTQLTQKVGKGGGAREVGQWYNDEILTNEKFRRDVFNQLGSFYISEGKQFDAAKGMFRKKPVETYGITANEDASQLIFSDTPMSRKVQEMVDAGRDMLISEFTGRLDENQKKDRSMGGSGVSPAEADSRIKFELFERDNVEERKKINKAYEDDKSVLQKGADALFPGVFPSHSPDQFDNIDRMIEIPPTEFKAGSDSKVVAVAIDRDEKMLAKVVTMVPGKLTEIELASGLTEAPETESVEYVLIPKEIRHNFFQEVGKKVDPKADDAVRAGREHMFNMYNKPPSEVAAESRLPNVQIQDAGLLPGEPADTTIDYNKQFPGNMEPMREYSLDLKLKQVFGDEAYWWKEWMRKDPKRFQEVMEEIDKGRRPYTDLKTGETVYETIR